MFIILISINSCNNRRKNEINTIFEKIKQVEILAYLDRNLWDKEDNPNYFKLNFIEKNGKFEINRKYIKNKIILNKSQLTIFKENLSKCKTEDWSAACFDPRHLIIFYDQNDKIYGYIELCFDCNRSKSSENLQLISECALGLEDTFKEFGITYFGEEENN